MDRTTAWHADEALLQAYVDGRLDTVLGASLERHVDGCAECRSRVRPLTDSSLLCAVWEQVRTELESPVRPRVLRWAGRLGLADSTAVLLSAAASMRSAWLAGSLVALGFAVLATALSGDLVWPFLLVAPLVPVLGVAASYGEAEDPSETVAVTTPYGRTRLVLLRTLGVLVTTVPPAYLLGLLSPLPAGVTVAWLGPALAMVPILLALAGFVGPRSAIAFLSVSWIGIVVLSLRRFPETWPVESTQQVAYLVLALLACAVLVVRARNDHRIGAAL